MAYYSENSIGDTMLYELARRAGGFGHFVLSGVTEVVHEATTEDGEYCVEVWLEFRVANYGTPGIEVHRLPGTLYWNLTNLYRETVTINVEHR